MAGLGANFTVSSAPATGMFNPEPEQAEPTPMENLQTQLATMQQKLDQQSRESAKKISELTEQNSLLNQSFQDMIQRQQTAQAPSPQEPPSGNVPTNGDGAVDWTSYWRENAKDTSPQDSGEEMNEQQINQAVDQRMQHNAQQNNDLAKRAAAAEQALINKFNTEELNLHPYANKVVTLWRRLGQNVDPVKYQQNPEATLQELYDETIKLSRDMFLGGTPPQPSPPPQQQRQQQFSGLPGGGQSRSHGYDNVAPPDPAMAGMDLPDTVRTEDDREKAMEQYILERKKAKQQRTGYFAIPGQR